MAEELNKKIAEWLGWEFNATGERFRFHSGASGWLYSRHLPKFTTSFDACFGYIVPKLDSVLIDCKKKPRPLYKKLPPCHVYVGKKEVGYFSAGAETPALALCRAVEKLIDGR